MFADTRLKATTTFLGDATHRRGARVVLLVLLCVHSALPLGGQVAIEEVSDGWRIRAEAPRLKVEPKLWQSLTDRAPADLVGSSDVEFAAAAKALAGYRMGLSFHPAEAGFEIVIQTN